MPASLRAKLIHPITGALGGLALLVLAITLILTPGQPYGLWLGLSLLGGGGLLLMCLTIDDLVPDALPAVTLCLKAGALILCLGPGGACVYGLLIGG